MNGSSEMESQILLSLSLSFSPKDWSPCAERGTRRAGNLQEAGNSKEASEERPDADGELPSCGHPFGCLSAEEKFIVALSYSSQALAAAAADAAAADLLLREDGTVTHGV